MLVLGGCVSVRPGLPTMIGAPSLCARGALRAGAGLVRLGVPRPIVADVLVACPSATGVPLPVDDCQEILGHEAAAEIDRLLSDSRCVVAGPGLGFMTDAGVSGGGSHGPTALVLRVVQQEEVPVVLDADGLNLLSVVREFWREIRGRLILTPHPGEYRRLASSLGIDADPVAPDGRTAAAEQLAQRLGAVVVLKGAGTVVSDGHRTWTCSAGHACLATAGTGDVLAGVIGGLVAQFGPEAGDLSRAAMLAAVPAHLRAALAGKGGDPAGRSTLDLFDCARLGVQAHALAGEAWAARHGESGLLASELADLIPEAMESLRAR